MANAATLRCLTNMDIYSLVFIYLKHEALEYACVRVRMRCMRWLIVVGAINKVWHEHQGLLFSSGEAGWTCFHSRPQRIFLYKNISKARRSDCGDYYFFYYYLLFTGNVSPLVDANTYKNAQMKSSPSPVFRYLKKTKQKLKVCWGRKRGSGARRVACRKKKKKKSWWERRIRAALSKRLGAFYSLPPATLRQHI